MRMYFTKQKTLELFLGSHVTNSSECDFIISDVAIQSDKRVFIVGKTLQFMLSI